MMHSLAISLAHTLPSTDVSTADRFVSKQHPTSFHASAQRCVTSNQWFKQDHPQMFGLSVQINDDSTELLDSCHESVQRSNFPLENDAQNLNVTMWNAAIRDSLRSDEPYRSLLIYRQMRIHNCDPHKHVLASVIKACCSMDSGFLEGQMVHAQTVVFGFGGDPFLGSALLRMYALWCRMEDARKVFDGTTDKDLGVRTAMLVAYVQNGDLESAREVFDEMHERDVVAWNAMISGYAQCGLPLEALDVFNRMLFLKVRPNYVTLVGALSACSQLGSLAQGEWIHALIYREKIKASVTLNNSLIHMYAKCGKLDFAYHMFVEGKTKNLESWNTMITSFAIHGSGICALSLFSQMIKTGLKPDRITFMGLLMACSHAGLTDDGWRCLLVMKTVHKIEPKAEHYGCLIDILSRRGNLYEAYNLLLNVSLDLDDVYTLGALLHGCLIHAHYKMGLYIARKLIERGRLDESRYVTLSNLLVKLGDRESSLSVRKLMEDTAVTKSSGGSVIEIDGVVHEFIAGDRSHRNTEEIYSMIALIHSSI